MSRNIFFFATMRAPIRELKEVSKDDMVAMQKAGDQYGHPVYWAEGMGVWPKFLAGYLVEMIDAEKV